MRSLFNLRIKTKGAFMVPFIVLLLSSQISAYAQTEKDDIYVDYNELIANVLTNLKAAQAKTTFISSAGLREQALTLPAESKARITSQLPKTATKELTGAQIVKARKNGVLMICKYLKTADGKPERIQLYATATALTSDGFCVSNWHVFMNFIQPGAKLPTNDSVTFVVNLKGDIYPIERVLAYNENADAAIFKINTGSDHLTTIPLGNDLAVGETVHTITNPEHYLYYYSKGVVARNTADHKTGPTGDRMEITADYAKGSSGGPILDDKGNMAGMVSTTHSIYAQDMPQVNLQMVIKTTIPVRSIRRLIQLP
jgi:serine protease Do